MLVDPAFKGLNVEVAVSLPPVMVTGEVAVPTDESEFVSETLTDCPPANCCVVTTVALDGSS